MRRAFTLLEVIVALTIAGLIALAARATLSAGIDTEERVQRHVTGAEGHARLRTMLVQMLRHMTDAPAPGLVPFVLRDTTVAEGTPSHMLEFYSRGLAASAGSGATVRVRLVPAAQGLTIEARGSNGSLRLSGVAPGVSALRVRLQTPAGDWVDTWPRTLQTPAAVAIDFTTTDGAAQRAHTPLFVVTALEGHP